MVERASLPKQSCRGIHPALIERLYGMEIETALELALAQGLALEQREQRLFPAYCERPIAQERFCIVDIETNGSKPDRHQIIEVGAVRVENAQITGQYESLVRCTEIPSHICEITGITVDQTAEAPTLRAVMHELRHFLQDDVFVGHDVRFDHRFTSKMMQRVGLEPMLNPPLCTIDLAERTLSFYRYGLAYLNEQLELYKEATHHRALSDAITTAKLFKRTLTALPPEIRTTGELIAFSTTAKRKQRPKAPPAGAG